MKPLKRQFIIEPQYHSHLYWSSSDYHTWSEIMGRTIENPVDRGISFPHVKNLILLSLTHRVLYK